MKPLRRRIRDEADQARLGQLVAERDYAQSYVLLGLVAQPELRETLVLKGGTALRKVHLGGYRFSEDLDFSTVTPPAGPEVERAVRAAAASGQAAARQFGDISMSVTRYEERVPHPGGQDAFVVRVQFPWQREPIVPIKIEITHDEPVLLSAPPLRVLHGYGEPFDVAVRTYALEEIVAEKLRSTRQTQARLAARGWASSRARDFYDLWHLVRLPARIDWARVSAILPRKCAHRQVRIDSVADVFDPALIGEVRASWDRTLGPFVAEIPDVEFVLEETRALLGALLEL